MPHHDRPSWLKMRLLIPGVLLGANAWLVRGHLAPIRNIDPPDFILLIAPFYELVAWAAAGVLVLHVLNHRRLLTLDRIDLSPLYLLVLPLAAVGMLRTPLRPYAGPWLFLFIDGRWWFYLAIGILQVFAGETAAAQERRRDLMSAWSRLVARPSAGLWMDAALVAVLAAAALTFSPPARFQSFVTGDEPKYVRFLEIWYRGNGLAVPDRRNIEHLPPGEAANVGRNLVHLANALPVIAADLTADARRMIGLSAPPHVGPATSEGGWFVEGKRGGVYQVHNPGMSALLFPGYVIDRYFLNWMPTPSQFPRDMYATALSLLVIYLLWGVAIFRLLLAYTRRPGTSWLLAVVVMLSLPASAFSYQYYREAAAGLVLAVLARYVIFSADTRVPVALGCGLLAGYLPWMHLRFGLAAVGTAVAFTLAWLDTFLRSSRAPARPVGLCVDGSLDAPAVGALLFDEYLAARIQGATEVEGRRRVAKALGAPPELQ